VVQVDVTEQRLCLHWKTG